MLLMFAASLVSAGTGDLVHYFSHGLGNPPEVKVDQTALCSEIGERDIKQQFAAGQRSDSSLKIDHVEVSCPTKTISTFWSSGQSLLVKPDQDRLKWRDEACYRHEIFFIAQRGWKITEVIVSRDNNRSEADAVCDGFSLANTDIMR